MNPEKMQSIYLQKQIKDNADDMRLFCEELKQWGEDAKRKDQQLRTGSVSITSNYIVLLNWNY